MMKRTLFILMAMSCLSMNVFASHPVEVNDDTGIWWSAMEKSGGSLVFKTDKGALSMLQSVVKNSEAGQSISADALSQLVKGDDKSASVNLRDLMSASLMALDISADKQKNALANYSKHHPNTKLTCERSKKHLFCNIQ